MNEDAGYLKLDATDLRLLELLQNDASLSNQALAERIGLSPSPDFRVVRPQRPPLRHQRPTDAGFAPG